MKATKSKMQSSKTEEPFRAVAEATGDAFYRLNYSTMKYEYLSPAIEKLTGYSPEEIHRVGFTSIITKIESIGDAEVSRETLIEDRKLNRSRNYSADYLIRMKNGEMRWLTDRSYPWYDNKGVLVGSVGILRDISERKQAQQALRESEERFRKLVEKSPDAIGVHCEGKIVFINSAGAKIFGAQSPGELIGKAIMDFVHPDYRALVLQRVRQTQVEKKSPDIMEEKFVRLDGAVIDVEVTALPITYMNKPASQLVVRDITSRKRAEESLRRSQQNYKAFIEKSSEGIWIIELDTPMPITLSEEEQIEHLYHHSVLAECNNALARMFGYSSADEIIGSRFGDFLDRADSSNRKFFRAFIRSGYHLEDAESHEVDKDGNSKYFLNNILGMVENGFLVRAWGSQRDITERKRLEQQLLQSQKMESLGTLAGGIAHDFNNILGIILGYAFHLDSHKTEPEKLSQSIDAINRAVNRGASVVRQLLTFARRYDVMFESINVNENITELAKLLEETFPKSVTFKLELEKNIPAIVADHHQLHQVLFNLCLNSRDAMPNGGNVLIKTRTVSGSELREHFADATEEEYVAINVSDTGIGMDAATRARIFEPFFTTKEHGKGTGLGLAVVYGVVKGHRGFIHVESEKEDGATFSIYLPVSLLEIESAPQPPKGVSTSRLRPDGRQLDSSRSVDPSVDDSTRRGVVDLCPNGLRRTKEDPAEAGGGNETILLVEDEPMLLELLTLVLQEKGYRTITATDGEEALELYRQNKNDIDLVLTDMGLPKLGGGETFQKMRKVNPDVKVILASGFVDPELKAEMINQGAKDFVQKPYVPGKILQRIREVLDAD